MDDEYKHSWDDDNLASYKSHSISYRSSRYIDERSSRGSRSQHRKEKIDEEAYRESESSSLNRRHERTVDHSELKADRSRSNSPEKLKGSKDHGIKSDHSKSSSVAKVYQDSVYNNHERSTKTVEQVEDLISAEDGRRKSVKSEIIFCTKTSNAKCWSPSEMKENGNLKNGCSVEERKEAEENSDLPVCMKENHQLPTELNSDAPGVNDTYPWVGGIRQNGFETDNSGLEKHVHGVDDR